MPNANQNQPVLTELTQHTHSRADSSGESVHRPKVQNKVFNKYETTESADSAKYVIFGYDEGKTFIPVNLIPLIWVLFYNSEMLSEICWWAGLTDQLDGDSGELEKNYGKAY